MADGLGLSGWVRNRRDGSVETLCSGDTETVNQMIDWLRLGPDSAVVDKIDIVDLEDQDMVQQEFTIRY
jgi:acylphosphatase